MKSQDPSGTSKAAKVYHGLRHRIYRYDPRDKGVKNCL